MREHRFRRGTVSRFSGVEVDPCDRLVVALGYLSVVGRSCVGDSIFHHRSTKSEKCLEEV